MAIAFSDLQPVEQLTAVAKEGKAPGELYNPRGVAIDPATNHIYVTDIGPYIFAYFTKLSVFSEFGLTVVLTRT